MNSMQGKKLLFELGFICILCVTGCVEVEDRNPEQTELIIYNWEDYLGPDESLLTSFEDKYNVNITLYTFGDEEEMIAELQSNPTKYDLIVTSDSIISDLAGANGLAELNKNNIPNIVNIDPDYLDLPFDPDNTYSIPYFYGTTGVAYNTSFYEKDIDSWGVLFDANYSGNITMLNNQYEVVGAALKYLGYPLNSENLSQLAEAEALLLEQKNIIQGYETSVDIEEKLVNGEVMMAHLYVGEAMKAAEENENITYIIPKEGAPIWIDCFAIPSGSQHKENAELFINYVLTPEISAEIIEYQWTASPNKEALKLVDDEFLNDPWIFPSEDILEKCEYFIALHGSIVNEYNRIWSELQE